jgi:DNA-binding transcriptional LysR family regulator
MNKSLPQLDFLRGFEAAARHLSFTEAAAELFITQSAVSRQIKALEERIGVALFIRRNRGLALTEPGEALFRAVRQALNQIADAIQRAQDSQRGPTLNITASVAFSALWLVPRLPRFRALRPDVDVRLSATSQVLDLDRDHLDIAIRYCAPQTAPAGAVRLFGADVVPVCAPGLAADPARPLRKPQDLAAHVLLHYDDPAHRMPWHAWSTWLEAAGVAGLRTAGALHFSHLDHAIQAAVAGEGVALGAREVLRDLFVRGELVMPFAQISAANRAYFALIAERARARDEAEQFVDWLRQEAEAGSQSDSRPADGPGAERRHPSGNKREGRRAYPGRRNKAAAA